MKSDNTLPGIHNWCDRCVFIGRCAGGSVEQQYCQRSQPMTDEEVWREVSDNFKKALRMLDGLP